MTETQEKESLAQLKDGVLDWFLNESDKGISSEAIAGAVLEQKTYPSWCGNHPSDPSDLNRCLKLLNRVPDIRNHMDKVAALSETWAKLVEHWDELEQCFLNEVGIDWEKGKNLSANKTYDLMKSLGC